MKARKCTCLNGRENQDVTYTLMLPVAKQDIVKGCFLFVILLELLQVAAFLRQDL